MKANNHTKTIIVVRAPEISIARPNVICKLIAAYFAIP